jgi:phosphomannomutase/phosphoglucomutase
LPGEGSGASLRAVRFKLLVGGVATLAALALFTFVLMSGHISRAIEQDTLKTSEQVASRVATLVEIYRSSLALLAKDPAIADVLLAGNTYRVQEREESLGYLFPNAINIQLLEPGIEVVNNEVSPPLGYAALAQMRHAETSESAPPAEVHQFNTPQQHINLVQRVMDPAGSGVVGHIMLSLSGDTLEQLLGGVQHLDGYIELQQVGAKGAPLTLASHGNPAFRGGEPGAVDIIPGSLWQTAYWSAGDGKGQLSKLGLWVAAAFLAAASIMVSLIMLLFRRLFAALHVDQVSLVTLLKDYRDRQIRKIYPHGLAEMEETLLFMTRLASARQPRQEYSVGGREQDDGKAAGATAGEPEQKRAAGNEAEFSTLPAESMIVEEDPLDIEPAAAEPLAVDASIFRAYDIRGVVNRTLTGTAVEQIGRAIGSEALQRGRRTVVVGRDGRLSGPELSEALIAGLMATGCQVKDIGVVPTPVLYFAANYLDTQTGVMLTGSHNPPDYNGLKIMIDRETLSGESIQQLRERIETANYISGQGDVESINVVPDYIERICDDVKITRPMKVVADCGNGVAGSVIPRLLRRLGCEVTELFCEVDGNFPHHHPDPSKPENLQDLIAMVKQNQADIGLAFDGDGDRLGVVTTEGGIIWPDRILMLFAADILDRNPGGQIIFDVKCSRHLDAIIREHGGKPLMWKTGHSFIKAKIRETGALLAGEMSGHIFFKERWFGFDDGLYAAARLLEVLGKDPRPAGEVFASLPDSLNTPELNITMQEGEPQRFIERLLASAHFDDARVSTIDGLRADFEDGWGLVRASNTTPVLVLRFEADDEAALARVMGEFRRVIQQVEPELPLPF